jgi:hypothetical protein
MIDQHKGYFSGTDAQRAIDVNDMFARKDIHLIISNRGRSVDRPLARNCPRIRIILIYYGYQ